MTACLGESVGGLAFDQDTKTIVLVSIVRPKRFRKTIGSSCEADEHGSWATCGTVQAAGVKSQRERRKNDSFIRLFSRFDGVEFARKRRTQSIFGVLHF